MNGKILIFKKTFVRGKVILCTSNQYRVEQTTTLGVNNPYQLKLYLLP